MDDTLRTELDKIGLQADDLQELVERTLDEKPPFAELLAVRIQVDACAKSYRESVARLDESDRFVVDRRIGRKILDLQKIATPLPAQVIGRPAAKTVENEFFATRAGKSSRGPRELSAEVGFTREARAQYRVSGEVDSWCGPCGRLTTHVIIALLEEKPAQVTCQVCGGRHKFRLTPARAKKAPTASGLPEYTGGSTYTTPIDTDSQRRAQEKKALLAVLDAAPTARSYDPKERYKAGEIIEHPEWGRGKIENTLPRSLMVRFPAGLKTLKLG